MTTNYLKDAFPPSGSKPQGTKIRNEFALNSAQTVNTIEELRAYCDPLPQQYMKVLRGNLKFVNIGKTAPSDIDNRSDIEVDSVKPNPNYWQDITENRLVNWPGVGDNITMSVPGKIILESQNDIVLTLPSIEANPEFDGKLIVISKDHTSADSLTIRPQDGDRLIGLLGVRGVGNFIEDRIYNPLQPLRSIILIGHSDGWHQVSDEIASGIDEQLTEFNWERTDLTPQTVIANFSSGGSWQTLNWGTNTEYVVDDAGNVDRRLEFRFDQTGFPVITRDAESEPIRLEVWESELRALRAAQTTPVSLDEDQAIPFELNYRDNNDDNQTLYLGIGRTANGNIVTGYRDYAAGTPSSERITFTANVKLYEVKVTGFAPAVRVIPKPAMVGTDITPANGIQLSTSSNNTRSTWVVPTFEDDDIYLVTVELSTATRSLDISEQLTGKQLNRIFTSSGFPGVPSGGSSTMVIGETTRAAVGLNKHSSTNVLQISVSSNGMRGAVLKIRQVSGAVVQTGISPTIDLVPDTRFRREVLDRNPANLGTTNVYVDLGLDTENFNDLATLEVRTFGSQGWVETATLSMEELRSAPANGVAGSAPVGSPANNRNYGATGYRNGSSNTGVVMRFSLSAEHKLLVAGLNSASRSVGRLKVILNTPTRIVVGQKGDDGESITGPKGNQTVRVYAIGNEGDSNAPSIPDGVSFDITRRDPFRTNGQQGAYVNRWVNELITGGESQIGWISEAEYNPATQEIEGSWSTPRIWKYSRPIFTATSSGINAPSSGVSDFDTDTIYPPPNFNGTVNNDGSAAVNNPTFQSLGVSIPQEENELYEIRLDPSTQGETEVGPSSIVTAEDLRNTGVKTAGSANVSDTFTLRSFNIAGNTIDTSWLARDANYNLMFRGDGNLKIRRLSFTGASGGPQAIRGGPSFTEVINRVEREDPIVVPADQGDQGPQGRYDVKVFRAVLSNAADPATPTASAYNPRTGARGEIADLTSGWFQSIKEAQRGVTNFSSSTHTVYEARAEYDPAEDFFSEFDTPVVAANQGAPGDPGIFHILRFRTVTQGTTVAAPTATGWTQAGGLTGLTSGWTAQPNMTGYNQSTHDIYISFIEIDPDALSPIGTITTPIQIDGEKGDTVKGDKGDDAVQPSITVPIFRRVNIGTAVSTPTTGNYNLNDNTFSALASGWNISANTAQGSGFNSTLHVIFISFVRVSPTGTVTEVSTPQPFTARTGLPGPAEINIYRAVLKTNQNTIVAPSNSGVTYNPSTNAIANLDNNWSTTPSYDRNTQDLYWAVAQTIPRHQATHTITAFSTPHILSGRDGATFVGYANVFRFSGVQTITMDSRYVGAVIEHDVSTIPRSGATIYNLPNLSQVLLGGSIKFVRREGAGSAQGAIRINAFTSQTIRIIHIGQSITRSSFDLVSQNIGRSGSQFPGLGVELTRVSSTEWLAHDIIQQVDDGALLSSNRLRASKLPTTTLYSDSTLNADNITTGTIDAARLPSNIGDVQALGFQGINLVNNTLAPDTIYDCNTPVTNTVVNFVLPNPGRAGRRIYVRRTIGGAAQTYNFTTASGTSGAIRIDGVIDQDQFYFQSTTATHWHLVSNSAFFRGFGLNSQNVLADRISRGTVIPTFAAADIADDDKILSFDESITGDPPRLMNVSDLFSDSRMFDILDRMLVNA